jgi:hypothetical protein
MFQVIDWIEHLCARIVYGPEDAEVSDPELMQALDRAFGHAPPDDFVDSWFQDLKKKERLSQELANAEWILRYDKRLAKLQKKTAAHRSKAAQAGITTERVRKLEHHLAGLRRTLD